MSKIDVTVKMLDGLKQSMKVELKTTIMELKSNLAEQAGLDPQQLKLIHKGKPCNDEKTISESKITNNSMIHLIITMRGGDAGDGCRL